MMITLQNLPEAVKENKTKNLAEWVIKYQKFNFKAAKQFAPDGYTDKSLQNYLYNGCKYLERGTINPMFKAFCRKLEELKQKCVQPLTPSLENRKREYKKDYTKKEATPPIINVPVIRKTLTAQIQYGVKFDDFIKLFESEEEAKAFNKGIEYAKGEAGKLVTVELGEV